MSEAITVLFVEDDDLVREHLSEVLPQHEFRSLIAESGNEAMRILREERVDVLFTDVVMPDLDGIELVKQAQLLRPNIKFVLMSGYLSRAAEAEALGRLLLKPVRPHQIEAAIRESLTPGSERG